MSEHHQENDVESRSSPAAGPPSDDFVELFSRHQRRIYLYILAQVPNPADADEILQETNLVIWRKCDRFRRGTNFFAWACQIATYEVLKFRDRRRRDKLYFSEEFVGRVADEAFSTADDLESRRKALAHCLNKLRKQDRELIRRRYEPGETGKSVARYLGRPVNSVYQSLGRIRRQLMECISRRLAAEAGP